MPKKTFYNLPKDKKDRIIEASINEFSEHSYKTASINRIVKSANIAKGSFYQYFENKMDLYKYTIEEVENTRYSHFNNILENEDYYGFFKLLREFYIANIDFARDWPKLSTVILKLRRSRESELAEVHSKILIKEKDILKKLVNIGINNWELKSSIELDFITSLLSSMNLLIIEYYQCGGKYNYDNSIIYIDNIIELLRDGVGPKRKSNRTIEDRFY